VSSQNVLWLQLFDHSDFLNNIFMPDSLIEARELNMVTRISGRVDGSCRIGLNVPDNRRYVPKVLSSNSKEDSGPPEVAMHHVNGRCLAIDSTLGRQSGLGMIETMVNDFQHRRSGVLVA